VSAGSARNDIRVNALTCEQARRVAAIFGTEFRDADKSPFRRSNYRETVKGTRRMRRKLTIALAVATLLGAAPLLSACYTAHGAGEDIQAAGHGLSSAASNHTGYHP
jgi:predicted small secreted protein